MTVTREPPWDDMPRSAAQGAWRRTLAVLSSFGFAARIATESFAAMPAVLIRSRSRHELVRQLYAACIRTLPVVTVVSLFIGMILALQVGLELRRFNQEVYLGAAVMVSLMREMGPFSCGMCLAACVGSAIAAELGTMKVNDEIAALEIMSISPVRFLAAPRMLALFIAAPLLGFFCCIIGAMGGGIVAATQLNVDFSQYMASALTMADAKDLATGLLKTLIFGTTIGTVAVYEGFSADMGATGVGRSTQRSVITSFLLILMLGYMVTRIAYR